jgi:hypothetical protein
MCEVDLMMLTRNWPNSFRVQCSSHRALLHLLVMLGPAYFEEFEVELTVMKP